MKFDFDLDQSMLEQTVTRLFETPADGRWLRLAESGLLALPLPEAAGGFGGAGTELMIVMEAIGRTLAPEPYLSAVVLGGGLLASDPLHHAACERLTSGEERSSVALYEAQSRYRLHDVATIAIQDGNDWIVTGRKIGISDADGAASFLVTARTSGERSDWDGISLFLVPADADGLRLESRRSPDGRSSANISLDAVRLMHAQLVGPISQSLPILRSTVDRAIAATCAEAVGAMSALLDLTVDYLKTRKQFGQTIGSFQALQHRAADMLVEVEQARSMAMYAAVMAHDENEPVRTSAVAAAKLQVASAARFVGQQAIQLHGGIGLCEEHAAGAYFKRLTQLEQLFGDDTHFLRVIDRCGGIGSDAQPTKETRT